LPNFLHLHFICPRPGLSVLCCPPMETPDLSYCALDGRIPRIAVRLRSDLRNLPPRARGLSGDGADGSPRTCVRVCLSFSEGPRQCVERSAMVGRSGDQRYCWRFPGDSGRRDCCPNRTVSVVFDSFWKKFARYFTWICILRGLERCLLAASFLCEQPLAPRAN